MEVAATPILTHRFEKVGSVAANRDDGEGAGLDPSKRSSDFLRDYKSQVMSQGYVHCVETHCASML